MSRIRAQHYVPKYYVPRTSTRIGQVSDFEQSCRNASVVNLNSNKNLPRTSTRIYRHSDFPLSDSVNRESTTYRPFRRENNLPAEQREDSYCDGSRIYRSFPTLPHRGTSNSAENRIYESSNFRRNGNLYEEEQAHPNSPDIRVYAQNLPKTSTQIYRHSDLPFSDSDDSRRESTLNRSFRLDCNFTEQVEESNCENSEIYNSFPTLPHRKDSNSAKSRKYESLHSRRNVHFFEEERNERNFSDNQRQGSSSLGDGINRHIPVRREENFSKQQMEDLNFYPYSFDRDPVTNVLYEMKTDNIDNVYGFRKRASQAIIFDHVIAVLMIQFVKSSEYPQPKHYREYEVCLQFLQTIRRATKRYIPAIIELINDHEVKLFELYCQMDVNDIQLDINNRTILEDPVPQSITIEDMLSPNLTVHNCYANTTAKENRLLLKQINTPQKRQNKSTTSMNECQQTQQGLFIPTGHSKREDLDFSIHSNEGEFNLSDHSIDVELNPSANSTFIGEEAIAQKNEPRMSRSDDLIAFFGTFGTILSNWQNQIVTRMEEDKRQIEAMTELISSVTKDYK